MNISRVLILATFALAVACKKEEAPAPAPAPAAKPTQQANAAGAAGNPAKPKAKKALAADKKPHAIPAAWTQITHEEKGFAFSVPAGSTDSHGSQDGVDVYTAKLPAPHDKVYLLVAAYKDAKKTKEDLLKDAAHILEATGAKEVKHGDVKELDGDHSLTDFTFLGGEKKDEKTKVRALVATDVTDNYVLLAGTTEDHFKQSEETVDTIWGSFEMFSGGSTGESK